MPFQVLLILIIMQVTCHSCVIIIGTIINIVHNEMQNIFVKPNYRHPPRWNDYNIRILELISLREVNAHTPAEHRQNKSFTR